MASPAPDRSTEARVPEIVPAFVNVLFTAATTKSSLRSGPTVAVFASFRSTTRTSAVEPVTIRPASEPMIMPPAALTRSTPSPVMSKPAPSAPSIVPEFVSARSCSACAPAIRIPSVPPEIVPLFKSVPVSTASSSLRIASPFVEAIVPELSIAMPN